MKLYQVLYILSIVQPAQSLRPSNKDNDESKRQKIERLRQQKSALSKNRDQLKTDIDVIMDKKELFHRVKEKLENLMVDALAGAESIAKIKNDQGLQQDLDNRINRAIALRHGQKFEIAHVQAIISDVKGLFLDEVQRIVEMNKQHINYSDIADLQQFFLLENSAHQANSHELVLKEMSAEDVQNLIIKDDLQALQEQSSRIDVENEHNEHNALTYCLECNKPQAEPIFNFLVDHNTNSGSVPRKQNMFALAVSTMKPGIVEKVLYAMDRDKTSYLYPILENHTDGVPRTGQAAKDFVKRVIAKYQRAQEIGSSSSAE